MGMGTGTGVPWLRRSFLLADSGLSTMQLHGLGLKALQKQLARFATPRKSADILSGALLLCDELS